MSLPPCPTCADYQLVPIDAAGRLDVCPDCRSVRCPVHGNRVAARLGEIVGICPRCLGEADAAIARMTPDIPTVLHNLAVAAA